jgi:hypothetical protein
MEDESQEETLEVLAPETRTHESWAEARGFLPQMIPGPSPADAPGRLMPNPLFDRYAGARLLCGWQMGQELTEREFDAAILAERTVSHH